ncbi:MAG TPA: hypothetical protein VMM36_11525 [Opitutaceae bacterium]|nr:hypothetical protein [Opitutaceae bacterium]
MKASRSITAVLGASLGLALIGCSGCTTAAMKTKATETVTTLGASVKARNVAMGEALKASVLAQLEAERQSLREQWEQKKSARLLDAKLTLDAALDARIAADSKKLEDALDPVFSKLKRELESARSGGSTHDEQAKAIALQLSASLAIATQEAQKLEKETRDKYAAAWTTLSHEIGVLFAMPAELKGAVDPQVVENLFKDLVSDGKAYNEAIDANVKALNGYITKPGAVELVARGLVGDNLYEKLSPLIAKTTASWQSKLDIQAERIATAVAARTALQTATP